MMVTVCETGTRSLLGAVFGPPAEGEQAYARRLAGVLRAGMLVLADRGFDTDALLERLAGTGAHVLLRAKASRCPPVLARLGDGSYLSRIGAVRVRIIAADLAVELADGTRVGGRYRLITTLTDHRRHPAQVLVELYHRRWEIETAYLGLCHTLLQGRVLRSGDPAGVEQELWGLLVLHQALRHATTAAMTAAGLPPGRACLTLARETAVTTVTSATGITDPPGAKPDPSGDIGRAVTARPLPDRPTRISARKVKAPISRYHSWNDQERPHTPTPVTATQITICPPPRLPSPGPPPATGPQRRQRVLAVLNQDPTRQWRAWDLAHHLGLAPRILATQLARWARQELITKTGRGTYQTLTTPQPP